MDGDYSLMLEDEDDEQTIAVPLSVMTNILERISVLEAGVDKSNEGISDLSNQLRKFEALQGTRDLKNAENINILIKALAAVTQDFHFPIKSMEDLNTFDQNLKKCSVEAERMVRKNFRSILDRFN